MIFISNSLEVDSKLAEGSIMNYKICVYYLAYYSRGGSMLTWTLWIRD